MPELVIKSDRELLAGYLDSYLRVLHGHLEERSQRSLSLRLPGPGDPVEFPVEYKLVGPA